MAAGLGVIGLMDAAAGAAATPEASEAAPGVTIVRRVVVPTTQPDVLLQATMGASRVVVRQAPAPIIRVRASTGGGGGGSAAPAAVQSTSSGS